jgi:transglutaminase-like putative cysteine protease
LRLKGIPYRFKIVSDDISEPFHHVFAEALLGGNWVPMDATYPENSFGVEQGWVKEETVSP